jgi:hypothetical protein
MLFSGGYLEAMLTKSLVFKGVEPANGYNVGNSSVGVVYPQCQTIRHSNQTYYP